MIDKKKKTIQTLLCLVLLIVLAYTSYAQPTQEILNQYISELQNSPNDNALREKIIKHVQGMNPAPAIPEEAKKYMVRGKAAFKGAKETKDFNDAASEFQKALLVAPWLAEGYYNLGIVQDKAGQHNAATQSLKLYLVAAPNAADAEKVKELIYEIEYRQEKVAKESSPQAVAQRQQNKDIELIKRLNGARYTYQYNDPSRELIIDQALDIRGNTMVWSVCTRKQSPREADPDPIGVWREIARIPIIGRQAELSKPGVTPHTYDISEDGNSITDTLKYGSSTNIFYRER